MKVRHVSNFCASVRCNTGVGSDVKMLFFPADGRRRTRFTQRRHFCTAPCRKTESQIQSRQFCPGAGRWCVQQDNNQTRFFSLFLGQDLSLQFSAVRKVSGDGNCFYRAFCFAHLESVLHNPRALQRLAINTDVTKRPMNDRNNQNN